MRKLAVLFLLAISFSATAADSDPTSERPGKITGFVIDKNLQEPLPYVTVVIKDLAGEVLTGGVTDDNGKFTMEKKRLYIPSDYSRKLSFRPYSYRVFNNY